MFAIPLKCVVFELEDGSVLIDLKTVLAKREEGVLRGPPCAKDAYHIVDGASVCADHMIEIVVHNKLFKEG